MWNTARKRAYHVFYSLQIILHITLPCWILLKMFIQVHAQKRAAATPWCLLISHLPWCGHYLIPVLLTVYNTQAYITLSWGRESCDIVLTRTGFYTAWYPIQKRPLCARLHWMVAGSWAVVPCNVNVTDATQHIRDVNPMLVWCWLSVAGPTSNQLCVDVSCLLGSMVCRSRRLENIGTTLAVYQK